MKILVTGANGQLGRELREVLDRRFPNQTVYTDLEELDITDAKAVKEFVEDGDFSHIVNCAGYTAVDRAEEEKQACARLNSDAVRILASVADSVDAKMIHISTDYVFDGNQSRPYNEYDKANPRSQYGITKRQGETALLAISPQALIIRTAWLYSPYGRNFVKTMLRKAEAGEALAVVADQIGTPTYAPDLANAIASIIGARQWVPGVYHYSNEGVASWYDFAKAVFRLAGNDVEVRPIQTSEFPVAATRPMYAVLDKTRIKQTYGVEVPYWLDSLELCIKRLRGIR